MFLTEQVPGDELKWVRLCTNEDLVAMASQNGMVILGSCEIVSSYYPKHFKYSVFRMIQAWYMQGKTTLSKQCQWNKRGQKSEL